MSNSGAVGASAGRHPGTASLTSRSLQPSPQEGCVLRFLIGFNNKNPKSDIKG